MSVANALKIWAIRCMLLGESGVLLCQKVLMLH